MRHAMLLLALAITAVPMFAADKVRISFVPPPMEGTISLGVYDNWGRLVRVLQQEAELDEFEVGPDALVTFWDGKDNDGNELPAGDYHARGFVVAKPNIQPSNANDMPTIAPSVRVKLVANPLDRGERASVDISVGVDDENAFVQTTDGLPLITVAPANGATSATFAAGRDNKSVTVFLRDATQTRRFDVSGLDKMMAFDCGEIELK